MSSIKNKMVSGVLWIAIGNYSTLLVQFIITIIIARILSPADYGIIGLLSVFVGLSNIILDSGFGQALIQKGNASNIDFSSVFYLNLILGIFLYIILFISSPYIASFYNLPELERISKFVFLVIPISSLGIIHNTMLERDMKFKKLSIVSVTSVIISGVVGILLAYKGYGVMSLVYQILVFNIAKTIILIIQNYWIPLFSFSFDSVRTLLPFSLNLLGTNVIIVLFNNIYTILIGKFYTSDDVGYYNQAKRFSELAGNNFTAIIFKVSFPALVNIKNDLVLLKKGYEKIINLTVFIIAPLMFGLMACSENLFIVLLTDKWLPAVPYFKILCLYSLTFPLHQINTNIFKVLGRGKEILFIEIFRRTLLVIAILLTVNVGVSALLIGQIISTLIIMLINMYYSGREINYSVYQQIIQILPYYLIAAGSFIVAYLLSNVFNSRIIELLLQIILFSIIYISMNIIFKLPAYLDCLEIIKKKSPFMKNLKT